MAFDIAIIGAGKIGRKHAEILDSMVDTNVAHVVDVDADVANDLAGAVDATSGTAPNDALSDCDAVFICTPDDKHADVTRRAIKADLHTFVEKPLATTLAAADDLVAAAEESSRVHMVGHILRFDPRYRTLVKKVDDVGRILSATVDRLVPRSRARRTGGASRPPMRLGVHDFDVLAWATDDTIERVRAATSDGVLREEGYDTEDVVTVTATFARGWQATFTLGYCVPDGHPGSIVRTRIVGSDGIAEVDTTNGDARLWDAHGGTFADTHLWPIVAGVPNGALANEDRAFVRALREGRPSPIPFSDGRRAVAVARAVERAAADGTTATVD